MTFPTLAKLPPPSAGKTGWPWTIESDPLPALMANGSPWPKISVVTPSYNQGAFLEETIRSVLLQGYPNLEYMIMDGGSTDESLEIILKYEPWLTHWVSEPDGGQSCAINSGWKVSTGDAVTWLNSDDTLEAGSLAAAAQALYEEADIGIVHGKVNVINAESRVINLISRNQFVAEDIIVRGITPFPQPGFLMKRQLLDRVGWLDESMQFCMDFDYWTRLALHDVRSKYVDRILANFRNHALSKSNTLYKTLIDERLRVYQKTFETVAAHPEYLVQRERARSYFELHSARIAYYNAHDAELTRRHAWRHIRVSKLHSSPRALILYGKSLGGKRSLDLIVRIRGWYRQWRL